jgi:hypothetical protein
MKHKHKILIILVLLITKGETYAMSDMYLFSEVKGVVIKNGIPVEGAVVEQEFRWGWKEEVGLVQTKTDSEGKFGFPAVIRNSFFGSLLPHEPMVTQTIIIKCAGNAYKAWMFDKGDYKDRSELNGKAISLYCELEEPLSHKGGVYGICQFR